MLLNCNGSGSRSVSKSGVIRETKLVQRAKNQILTHVNKNIDRNADMKKANVRQHS